MKKIVISIITSILVLCVVLGFFITPKAFKPINEPIDGIKPFNSSNGICSNYYRIPSMITTENGTVVSAIDARFGGTHDSPNNIDTAVSLSYDNGESWEESGLVLSFDDWQNSKTILKSNGNLTTKNSASTIDPALLEDKETGRIFMLVDAYTSGTGVMNGEKGSGYTDIDGNKYLMLKKKGEKNFNYTVRENGIIYDSKGEKTDYSVNEKFELSENGNPLMVKQKKMLYWYYLSFGINTKTQVPMNIMYKDALFQPLNTSYLYLIYSDDEGKTWSNPINLNAQVKSDDQSFMGVCPGRGIQIKNGKYSGRLIFMTYYLNPENMEQRFAAIYSDDNGKSWKSGDTAKLSSDIPSASETQLVQYPDGSLKAFSRSTIGNVVSSKSRDGGMTWEELKIEKELVLTSGSGCQLSVINYEGKIDGKDAVLLSAPSADGRKNGYIYIGLISNDNDSYNIEWKYKKEITDKDTHFAYSCMTQLPNGKIGLLYEQANAPQTIDTVIFKSYTVSELCENNMD